MNLVDDRRFTGPLIIKALRGHVDAFAADLAAQTGRDAHEEEQRQRPCAAVWVYMSCLVAWAQDHELLGGWLREPGETARARRNPPPEAQMRIPVSAPSAWLTMAIAALATHPDTACLLDPRYSSLKQGKPSDAVCGDLLDWWAKDAPCLAWPDPEHGPTSLSGWLAGDLLQALSDERRTGYALAQTPWWVADLIIDHTLVPAANEFRDTPLRTVDPACGTGHFLIRKIDYLWELYTTGQMHAREAARVRGTTEPAVTGWAPVDPREAIRRILTGVHGMERDPLTAAVARLRMVVAIGDLMHRSGLLPELRLHTIPPVRPVVGVGDSLLWGVATPEQYTALHPELADIQPPPPVGATAVKPAPSEQLDLLSEGAA